MRDQDLPVYLFEMRQFIGGRVLVLTTLVRSRDEAAAAAAKNVVDNDFNIVWKLLPVDSAKAKERPGRRNEV